MKALFSFFKSMLLVAMTWLVAALLFVIKGDLILAGLSILMSILMLNWYRGEQKERARKHEL